MASKKQKTPKAAPKTAQTRDPRETAKARDPRAEVVDAALRMAALRDWANITLADIADEAKVGIGQMAQMFECREDIVAAYARRVDADVLASFKPSGSERDMLFDVLMERFDRLNRDRDAVVSILNTACRDPKQMVVGLPHIARSMLWMLEACGIDTQGIKGAVRVAGLTGVYVWTLRTWREDDSADMGRTMATLDRAMGRVDSFAGMVGL